ncbi:MAG TPA: hypothetical protein VIG99_08810 [Myxococcaceae bacterium]
MAPYPWLVMLALAASNPDVGRAIELMDELKYPEAARALEDARKRPGNDRATLLQILEMQAVVASTLEQADRTRAFFRTLVSIDPDYKLSRNYASKVLKSYFDAKLWISRHGTLGLQADPATPPTGPISSVGVRVTNDTFKLAREVRLHLRADDGRWRVELAPLAAGRASVPLSARRLEWWAELLGEAQAVLTQVGSERQPVLWGVIKLQMPPPPPGLAERPALPGPRIPAPPKGSSQEQPPVVATLGWGLVALGGASAGAGGYFGLRSFEAREQVRTAQVDPTSGLTLGLTQKEAFVLDARARQDAVVANVLFGVAGAAAVGGVVLLVFGRPVEVGVSPRGVSLESPIP